MSNSTQHMVLSTQNTVLSQSHGTMSTVRKRGFIWWFWTKSTAEQRDSRHIVRRV